MNFLFFFLHDGRRDQDTSLGPRIWLPLIFTSFFYLCTSFSPPQSLSFQPFCVTTENTKGEVHLKQNRSYPSFLVFRPGENVGEANRAPSFQSWQTSSQSRYPNIYSAVEFVMNVTSGIRVRYFWAAGRFFKNLSEKLPCLSTSPNSG